MTILGSIVVRERLTEEVGAAAYRLCDSSPRFWTLAEAGVVSLVRSKNVRHGLRAASLVGQAVLEDGTSISVREKSAGALSALLQWSLPEDVREVDAASGVGQRGEALTIFTRKFLEHLGYYLRLGRLKTYSQTGETSSIPRGALDLARTLRLRARGRRCVMSQRRSVLTADTEQNRLLSLGLRAVRTFYASRAERSEEDIVARTYAPLFDDVNVRVVQRERHERLFGRFREAMADRRTTPDLRTALAYARAVVLNFGAWADEADATVPHAFFLNLETLWEDAVRGVIGELLRPLRVHHGSEIGMPLFKQMAHRYVADPDFVAGREGRAGDFLLVGDCKYKDLEDYPSHADVYQIAAHCATLGCSQAVLIYPGGWPFSDVLGDTRFGPTIHWVKARPSHLKDDLTPFVRRLLSKPSAVA